MATTSTTVVPATGELSSAEIDVSCRPPLMLYFGSGLVWLFVGTLFWFIASIKSHGPGFLADTSWLTLGRVRPAGINAIVYGFAAQTAFGVLLWLMCRLGNVRLLFQPVLCVAGLIWNLALTAGIIGILAGASTGYEWLEMPKDASILMLVAYLLIGLCAVTNFHFRNRRALYPSQWYIFAALFWFAWIFSGAVLLLFAVPARGAFQTVVNGWYVGNLLDVWLTAVGLAIVFYFLPKLLARPLYSSTLAAFGFWTFAAFAPFTGMTRLMSGPVPVWIPSTGTAATVLMSVPLLAITMNWYLTTEGKTNVLRQTEPGRFIWFAAISYLIGAVVQIVLGFREVAQITQFTFAELARTQLTLHGFVGMALFGAVYYIVPRITRVEWPAPKAVRLHFTLYASGVALIFLGLLAGGVVQGLRLNRSVADFVNVIRSTIPFVGISTLGILLLLVAEAVFLKNFFTLWHRANEAVRTYAIDFVTGRETAGRSA